MYMVLGGRGAVGQWVCKVLNEQGKAFTAPSSRELDARDGMALSTACAGASAIICCVGLPYRAKIWERDLPKIANALITAAERTGARILFLDNVYLYGPPPLRVPIIEDHPQRAPSRKGRARRSAVERLLKAHEAERAAVTIARAADFYGPGARDSALWLSFLERMMQGKGPQLLMNPTARHTYSFTPDIARALVQLAGDEGATGRAWHLPVGPAVTPEDWVERFNTALGTTLRASYLQPSVSRLLRLVSPLVREADEMRYQFDSDYVLSDADFRARYQEFETTPYDEGATQTVAWGRKQIAAL